MEAAAALVERSAFQAEAARWHMLAIFCGLTFTNAYLWISFSPIAALAEGYYGVSTTSVNALSVVFMLVYAPGSLAAVYIVTRSGLGPSIHLAALLNAAGGWVRYASVFVSRGGGWPLASYAVLLVGQVLVASGSTVSFFVPRSHCAGDC